MTFDLEFLLIILLLTFFITDRELISEEGALNLITDWELVFWEGVLYLITDWELVFWEVTFGFSSDLELFAGKGVLNFVTSSSSILLSLLLLIWFSWELSSPLFPCSSSRGFSQWYFFIYLSFLSSRLKLSLSKRSCSVFLKLGIDNKTNANNKKREIIWPILNLSLEKTW